MIVFAACRSLSKLLALSLFGFVFVSLAGVAQDGATVTEITPGLLVFSTAAGNVVASVGPDGALLAGTPSAASTPRISSILAGHTRSPVRYVVIAPEDTARSEGDAGWGRRGAFVAMQENELRSIGGNVMGAPQPLSKRFAELGVNRPRIAFSEVLAFDLNGESIHVVHQAPGYSNADTIVHFHVANLVYLGEVFPGDGYPAIDTGQGGTLVGLLKTLNGWTDSKFRVVPVYGKVTTGASVKAFADMVATVRDRVQQMINAGKSEDQILAEHPTADFDATWGHGRIQADAFVREVYGALAKR
jgi:cyclase